MTQASNTHSGKDRWDKLDVLLKPVGGIITGLLIATIGYWSTQTLQALRSEETKQQELRQVEETNRRLYTEIMSSREKADTDLRKEMFNAIIKAFLTPQDTSLTEKALALELLAYNFHDVIDLSPLFKHIASKIENEKPDNQEQLTDQLERVSREVNEKQIAALGDVGTTTELLVNFKQLKRDGMIEWDAKCYPLRSEEPAEGPEEALKRYIYVVALGYLPERREITVHLESGLSPCDKNAENAVLQVDTNVDFRVGFFDFPMIDNTRVPNAQRIAIALTHWDNAGASLKLVYFPGSRASLKEKPYYEEIIEQLHRTNIGPHHGEASDE